MSFIAKNPLIIPEVKSSPSVPKTGTRGIFAGKDGWYDVDSNNNAKRIATVDDIAGGGSGSAVVRSFVNILGGIDKWTPENVLDANNNIIGTRYGQTVNVNNAVITPNSKVDLQISSEQMVAFYEKDLAFVAENEDGVVTVYCIGNVPENNYTLQATVTEVIVNG